jgi:hypothetical protein
MARKTRKGLVDQLGLGVASGMSVRGAGRAAGISQSAAQRMATTPEFAELVQRIRRELVSRTIGRLSRLSVKAAATLGRLLDSPAEDVRLKAATVLIDKLLSVSTHADLEERIEQLEKAHEHPKPYGAARPA